MMLNMQSMARVAMVSTLGLGILLGADAATPDADAPQAPEADRQAILKMAGDFKVTFDFEDTLIVDPESVESEPHHSVAYETVRVLEDRGDFISLQQFLMVGEGEDVMVIKHWRQDWQYEDASVISFRGGETWEATTLTPAQAKGTWTQTVYMVDDSPRYESWGEWQHVGDTAYWVSKDTWRPLPRREKARKDDYDVLVTRNQHTILPNGWAHEQVNYKLDTTKDNVLAWEHGMNTYIRTTEYDFSPAHEYWDQTAQFWSHVRDAWNDILPEEGILHVNQPEGEKPFWRELMTLADDYSAGKLPEAVSREVLAERFNKYIKVEARQ